MQRALTATLGAATIALPTANAVAAVERSAATAAAPKKTVVTRKVSGSAVEADRWGTVQVNVTVRKTTVVVNGVKKVTRKMDRHRRQLHATTPTARSTSCSRRCRMLRQAGAAVAQRERRH